MTPLPKSWIAEPLSNAGTLVAILGLLGSLLGPDWLILFTGIGLFGPLLLRESGAVRWRDEFQRETNLRACTHASIAVGILATGTMVTQGFGGLHERMDSIEASTVLWVLALTWGMSRILQFWSAPGGAFRLLLGYAAVLLVVATTPIVLFGTAQVVNVKTNPPSGLLWAGILAWLLVLIVLMRRRPRTSGWLLLLTAALAVPLLRDWVAYLGGGTRGWTKTIDVLPLAVLPLLAAGLSLTLVRRRDAEDRHTVLPSGTDMFPGIRSES
jgi:hypothetical protein